MSFYYHNFAVNFYTGHCVRNHFVDLHDPVSTPCCMSGFSVYVAQLSSGPNPAKCYNSLGSFSYSLGSFSYNRALFRKKNIISMSDSIFETEALGCNEHGLWDSIGISSS